MVFNRHCFAVALTISSLSFQLWLSETAAEAAGYRGNADAYGEPVDLLSAQLVGPQNSEYAIPFLTYDPMQSPHATWASVG